jgi:regulator of PEP synthase PpsR (kinase-PPPase family)
MMKTIPIYLISDSTGDTVHAFARAALAQFMGVRIEEHSYSLVRTERQLESILEILKKNPGPVLYTLVDKPLRRKLKQECSDLGVPCIAILAKVVEQLSDYLKIKSTPYPGKQHVLDEQYFNRVEALHYTLAHDDGQITERLETADIILVGVSRTSKTPTSVYLAYRGYRTANIPYVKDVALPSILDKLTRPLIVGLTIQEERLIDIRKNRLLSLQETNSTAYVDAAAVKEEIAEAKQYFTSRRWPVIDVTRRSVEETVATILQYYQHKKDREN